MKEEGGTLEMDLAWREHAGDKPTRKLIRMNANKIPSERSKEGSCTDSDLDDQISQNE